MNCSQNNTPVKPGEFSIAAMALDHGHINSLCEALVNAGASLKWVYDPVPDRVELFRKKFPEADAADCPERILDDPGVKMIAAAAIPNLRAALGIRVMEAGKDYFTDKAPFTEISQLEAARRISEKTGRKYLVYYGDTLESECVIHAKKLIGDGAIGRIVHITGFGPHRLNAGNRPPWFFRKAEYGGILCDLGIHQTEFFLAFTGAGEAEIVSSHAANYHHPNYPELEDFGEAILLGDNGISMYFQVDWFTPDGLSTWGDSRFFITGTEGAIELRLNVNVAADKEAEHLFLVDKKGEHHLKLKGKAGIISFRNIITDCLNRTETVMTQEHIFKAAELSLAAQEKAKKINQSGY
jgi:predicted dehydrogenase